MSIFKEIVSLWKSKDLMSQAWDESYDMLVFSEQMFSSAVKYLRKGEKTKVLKTLKKEDQKINSYQQGVRKKVVTHFSVSKNLENFPSGLVLLNIVSDVERLGDYTKNILDLAIHFPEPLISENILDDLKDIEEEVISRFKKTLDAINEQDAILASDLLDNYKANLASISDKIVHQTISGSLSLNSNQQSSAVTLYARYLKRVGAHLKNITTTILNPYEYIGYNKQN